MNLAADQFENINPNFGTVTFNVTDGYQTIVPVDEVVVTITGHNNTTAYDGASHSVNGYDVEISNSLYKEADFTFDGKAEASRTNAGTTNMGLAADQFANTNDNFAKVTFNVTDGYQTITPIDVVVTITGNSDTATYDGKEHSVSGFTATASSNLYDMTKDFTFSGEATAKGTDAGTYNMNLKQDQFTNTSDNFNVQFVVNDGTLEIEPAQITNDFDVTDPEDVEYNGKAQEQKVTVVDTQADKGATLKEGKDYELSYSGDTTNVTEGGVTITITGTGNYTGTITRTYHITPVELTLTSASDRKVYDGKALRNSTVHVSLTSKAKTINADAQGSQKLLGNDVITFNVTGSRVAVGTSVNAFTYAFERDVVSGAGAAIMNVFADAFAKADGSIAGNYVITKVNGTLTVTQASTPTPTPTPTPGGGNNPGGGNPVVAAPAPAPAAPTTIVDDTTPTTITDEPLPRTVAAYWALINLICAILTALLSLIMLIRYFGKRREEDEETGEVTEIKRKGGVKLASIIPAIGAIIAFILTEDMTLPMQMVDKWTLLMVVILAIQVLVAFFSRKKEEEDDQEDEGAMA